MSETAVAKPGTRLQNFLDRAGLRGFPWKTATILYTISWGWLFIVRDSLWADDWVRFIVEEKFDFREFGLAPWLYYERNLFYLLGLAGIRTLIFLVFFISGLAMFGILSKITILECSQRKFFILLFIIIPFNTARVALQSFHYTIGYVLFFVAWYVIINFYSRLSYYLSLVLFFFSFGMHSLLPFYLLPVLHLFFLGEIKSLQIALGWIKRNIVLIMLPLIYWTIRHFFWPETSANLYHDITTSRVYRSVNFSILISVLLLILYKIQRRFAAMRHGLRIVMVGIFSMSMGILAYVVLGFFRSDWTFGEIYLITFLGRSDWYSRHQILQPLGAALVTVGVIELISKFRRNEMKNLQSLILAICVVINTGFGFEYVVDYSKQKVVISELKRVGDDKTKSATQFVDQTTLLNARGHVYRPWDWSGLIWRAYGFEARQRSKIEYSCETVMNARLVLIQGPETHWEALKNWVSDGDMGFKVTVDDTPGACKSEMVTSERVSGAIPILFYFTGVKG